MASALITGEQVQEPDALARNALGLREVLFCIVTGAAPIAAMQFNVPWAVGGAGYAGPATFLLATIILTIFSVGYIEMARRVTAAGGFYSFISHAFGSVIGMGSAITIALAYTIFSAANVGVTAYFAQSNVATWTNGSVDIPIGVIYIALILIAAAFAYFHIELTAKVLGVCLVTEVLCLLVFDARRGAEGRRARDPARRAEPGQHPRQQRCQGRSRCARRRRVLRRLLVVGRLRDGAELRRGVAQPEEDDGLGHLHLGDRPRRHLHLHVLDVRGRLGQGPVLAVDRPPVRDRTAAAPARLRVGVLPAHRPVRRALADARSSSS